MLDARLAGIGDAVSEILQRAERDGISTDAGGAADRGRQDRRSHRAVERSAAPWWWRKRE